MAEILWNANLCTQKNNLLAYLTMYEINNTAYISNSFFFWDVQLEEENIISVVKLLET